MSKVFSLDYCNLKSAFLLRDYLYKELEPAFKLKKTIIFLCIGSDRSTGDCLGPLIGSKLNLLLFNDSVKVYGTLEKPVHAQNLVQTLEYIKANFKDPFIIAIDACLGKLDNVGKIFVEDKPLRPGLAVSKDLPPVGDLSITGIVNISGALEFMVLQNTRLFTVMTLADTISRGINHCVIKALGIKKHNANQNLNTTINAILS